MNQGNQGDGCAFIQGGSLVKDGDERRWDRLKPAGLADMGWWKDSHPGQPEVLT